MKLILVAVGVLGLIVLMQMPQQGSAECCRGALIPKIGIMCGDCKMATPFCGKGKCDRLGCECEGGCRYGACYSPGDKRRSEGDVDGDGRLTVLETRSLLKKRMYQTDPEGNELTNGLRVNLRDMDTDNDGYLSIGEIDKEYM